MPARPYRRRSGSSQNPAQRVPPGLHVDPESLAGSVAIERGEQRTFRGEIELARGDRHDRARDVLPRVGVELEGGDGKLVPRAKAARREVIDASMLDREPEG